MVLGDFQTRSGITPNAMSLVSGTMPRRELLGEPTLSCGPLTEAAIRNGVPGVVCESYESNQASVASASDRLESSRARIYQQGSLEKDWHHRRGHSESRTELMQELPSGRPIRSWSD